MEKEFFYEHPEAEFERVEMPSIICATNDDPDNEEPI